MTVEPVRIVFVCVENSNRSQMAEGFARAMAPAGVEAYSAGSRPSGKVNERAIRFMLERGVNIARQKSKGLDALPRARFAAAITMGCGDECPLVQADVREDWALPDPKGLDDAGFREVRDRIRENVARLLARLRVSAGPVTS